MGALEERGFAVIPDVLPRLQFDRVVHAYDRLMCSGDPDIKIGSTTTRLADLVNRDPAFDVIYTLAPLLDACSRIIGRPFKLSSIQSRTLRPQTPAQELHVDVPRASADWPLVGFILMIDAFHPDNGATRFVPGSHRRDEAPCCTVSELQMDRDDQQLACGSAGSLLVFNGSTWHGHTANRSTQPRRSIQGAFIPLAGRSATDFSARMSLETRQRLTPQARRLLSIDQ